MSAKYPATNNDEAVALNIQNANQFHTVVNGSIVEEIETFEGNGNIPSVAKALFEAAAYRVPLDWTPSSTETDLMQPRSYNGNIYVPVQVPAVMDAIPNADFWRLYSAYNYTKADIGKEIQTGSQVVGGVSTLTEIIYEVGSNNLLVIVDGVFVTNYEETSNTSITWDSGTEPDSTSEIVFIAGDYLPVDDIYEQIIVARNEAVNASRPQVVEDINASYDISAMDENKYRRFTNASSVSVNVQVDSLNEIPLGAKYNFIQAGDGQVTAVNEAGVQINSPSTLSTRTKYSSFSLIKVGQDEWDISGDLQEGIVVVIDYPLDATDAEIQASGQNPFPVRADDFTVEYSVVGGAVSNSYSAFPTGVPASQELLDLSGGQRLIELEVTSLPESSPDTDGTVVDFGYGLGLYLFDFSASTQVTMLAYTGDNATNPNAVNVTTEAAQPPTNFPQGSAWTGRTIAIGYDSNDSNFVFFVDGVEVFRGTSSANPSALTVALLGSEQTNELANAGNIVSGELRAIASKIQTTYPAGWQDAFGQSLA